MEKHKLQIEVEGETAEIANRRLTNWLNYARIHEEACKQDHIFLGLLPADVRYGFHKSVESELERIESSKQSIRPI